MFGKFLVKLRIPFGNKLCSTSHYPHRFIVQVGEGEMILLFCDILNCSYTVGVCGIYPYDAIRQFICMWKHKSKSKISMWTCWIVVVLTHIHTRTHTHGVYEKQKTRKFTQTPHWFIVDKWINYDCLIPWIKFSAPESSVCVCGAACLCIYEWVFVCAFMHM